MDSIQDILQCKWCLSQFTNPVNLPCGDTICEKHTKELRASEWKCLLCDGVHVLARGEKYLANKPLAALLKTNISKLDFGPIHKKAKLEVEAAEAKQRELMHAIREPKDYVATFATKYRNQIDLAREEMVNIIDGACENMKVEISQYETKSEERLRLEAAKMNQLTRTVQSKTSTWKKNLDELVVNEPLWNKIVEEAKSYQEQINAMIHEALAIPPNFKHIKMRIQRNAWLKLSSSLQISPVNISDMRDEKCVLVRDVSKIAQTQSWKRLVSSIFDVRGFKFHLSVVFEMSDGKLQLGAYLNSQSQSHHKYTVEVKWKHVIYGKFFQIIGQMGPLSKEFGQLPTGWGYPHIMSLSDIMAHPAYDAQEDVVRVEVEIDHNSVQVKNV